jgi:hypothetical protein
MIETTSTDSSTEETMDTDNLITELFENPARELCHRSADGIDVRLVWYSGTETLAVVVDDPSRFDILEVPVGDNDPMDVYEHPFYHAGRLGQDVESDDLLAA